jgi:hypothetical protein
MDRSELIGRQKTAREAGGFVCQRHLIKFG